MGSSPIIGVWRVNDAEAKRQTYNVAGLKPAKVVLKEIAK